MTDNVTMRKFLFRILAVLPAIALQLLFYLALFKWLGNYLQLIILATLIVSFALVVYIMDSRMESNYKTLWLVAILLFPLAGTWLYLICGHYNAAYYLDKKVKEADCLKLPPTDDKIVEELKEKDLRMAQSLLCLSERQKLPIARIADYHYYPLVDEAYPQMLAALGEAKKFIFLEYFIIADGQMWDGILQVLRQKVKEGVQVYVLYDDLGSIFTYSIHQLIKLNKEGIHCTAFNPLITIRPFLNNRDHRKMMIIDNEIVFAGGFNLADEYINIKSRYGHWKDICFCLNGEAVASYSAMFVQMWNAVAKEKIDPAMVTLAKKTPDVNNGYCLVYCDSPANEHSLSNTLFSDLLSQCTKRAWFYTPYLILSDSLREALISAAMRGVDVRIITPGIPDSKIVHLLTQGNYQQLLANGVQIYEYRPGFLHGKAAIFDDVLTIGSVNLDYRSLFLHYECNCLFYDAPMLKAVEQDYLATLQKCEKIPADRKTPLLKRIITAIIKVFGPLC